MEHEFLPKVPGVLRRTIEIEVADDGTVTPEFAAKQLRFQIESMIREMKKAFRELTGEDIPLEVAWVEND